MCCQHNFVHRVYPIPVVDEGTSTCDRTEATTRGVNDLAPAARCQNAPDSSPTTHALLSVLQISTLMYYSYFGFHDAYARNLDPGAGKRSSTGWWRISARSPTSMRQLWSVGTHDFFQMTDERPPRA
jgi:hypothetical protein